MSNRNSSYLEVKVTFIHIVVLLVSVIIIGIFLFYIGYNAGKNANENRQGFPASSNNSPGLEEINIDTGNEDDQKSIEEVEEPGIKEELNLYSKKKPDIQQKKVKKPISVKRQGYYSIQVGSFKNHTLAKNYAKKFSLKGYQSEVSQIKIKNKNWFRVKIGNFENLDKAKNEKKKLEKMEKKKFSIVKSG
ncbi:MAG: SPOR domain-containing protein [Acidobacteriota bacterium]